MEHFLVKEHRLRPADDNVRFIEGAGKRRPEMALPQLLDDGCSSLQIFHFPSKQKDAPEVADSREAMGDDEGRKDESEERRRKQVARMQLQRRRGEGLSVIIHRAEKEKSLFMNRVLGIRSAPQQQTTVAGSMASSLMHVLSI
ncbi:hypothetical protein SAY87_009819 [Trapa incisa]|uniref:Uncharacterized protein n=1 Tax=Trapa incisa TaxID=236973 RepID=A0AAN7PXU2_9MYRT|nr:hypothetical protein SAY87_009819 [Trapa incisa]